MKLFSKYNGLTFEIEEDFPEVGFYFYVYDKNGQCTHDYLQNTEQIAKEFALEKFNVLLDSWAQIED